MRVTIDKQLLKGTLPLLVLRLLEDDDLYGYELIKTLHDASRGAFRFGEGSLYPVLHSLEREGHLRSYWSDSEVGRKRKYYAITASGRGELAERGAEWRAFAGGIDAVLGSGGGEDA